MHQQLFSPRWMFWRCPESFLTLCKNSLFGTPVVKAFSFSMWYSQDLARTCTLVLPDFQAFRCFCSSLPLLPFLPSFHFITSDYIWGLPPPSSNPSPGNQQDLFAAVVQAFDWLAPGLAKLGSWKQETYPALCGTAFATAFVGNNQEWWSCSLKRSWLPAGWIRADKMAAWFMMPTSGWLTAC